MDTIRPRRAAVLLLGAVLLLSVFPASAHPTHDVPGAPLITPSLLDTFRAWLGTLWPAGGPDVAPSAAWAANGRCARAATEPRPPEVGLGPGGAPTGDPERGDDLDPDG